MGRCWSCGSQIPGGFRYLFTCPNCAEVEEIKKIRERIESSGASNLPAVVEAFRSDLGELSEISEAGFNQLSEELANIASIFEWGFEEIEWKLDQLRVTLKSIDDTLKTPSQTKANEWRQIAEELRERGVLDESEKFLLKSLESNPLDYRTYIGLGKTYLQIGKLNEVRTHLRRSLPHAPKTSGFDYKSYSYRLIGRTYFCEENYQQAVLALRTAIELSPDYYLGHYDYAQYCALIGGGEHFLDSLMIAIIKEPLPFELVRKEKNFERCEKEVEEVLENIESSETIIEGMGLRGELKSQIGKAEDQVKGLHEAISGTKGRDSYREGVYYWTTVSHYNTAADSLKRAQKIMSELPLTGIQLYQESEGVRHIVRCALHNALDATWWALTGKKSLGMKIDEEKRNAISLAAATELNEAIRRRGQIGEIQELEDKLANDKTKMRENWKKIEEDETKRRKWEEIQQLKRPVGKEEGDYEEEEDFEV